MYLHRQKPGGCREFLLLRRTAALGGFWQGVTGAPRDREESDEDAAVREVREETGLDVAARLEAVGYRYELYPGQERAEWDRLYGPGVESVPEEVYSAEVPPGTEPALDGREHTAYRWCTVAEASALLHWPENRAALEALAAKLGERGRG